MSKDDKPNKIIDLRSIRENMGLTQIEFANLLNTTQDKISRIEAKDRKDTDKTSIDLDLLLKLSQISGLSLDELVAMKQSKVKAVEVTDHWKENLELKNKLLKGLDNIKDYNIGYINSSSIKKYIYSVIRDDLRKTSISFIGLTNAGKSSFINHLIGVEKLPRSLEAETRTLIYIKHKDDKPSFIQDEVAVFRDIKDLLILNEVSLSDEEKKEQFEKNNSIIAQGDSSILEKYCTWKSREQDAKFAVIYVDSDILKNVDLVDYPGIDINRTQLDESVFSVPIDAVVYLSRAVNFMSSYDVEYLRLILSRIASFDVEMAINKSFIICSQANMLMSKDEVNKRIEEGYNTFSNIKTSDNDFFTALKSSKESLKNRFYAYDIQDDNIEGMDEVRDRFNKDFTNFIETIPEMKRNESKTLIKELVLKNINELDSFIELHSRLSSIKNLQNRKLLELEKENSLKSLDDKSESFVKDIKSSKKISTLLFEKKYNEILNENNILDMIKTNDLGVKQKKNIEKLINVINAQLDNSLKEILDEQSKEIFDSVKDFVRESENQYRLLNSDMDYEQSSAPYVEKIEYMDKKILKVLSAILGGAAVAIIPFYGLTILLTTGMSALLGLGIVTGLAGVWQKDIARKIIKHCDENNVYEKFVSVIEDYWDNVEKTVIEVVNKLKEKLTQSYNYRLTFDDSSNGQQKENAQEFKKQLQDFLSLVS